MKCCPMAGLSRPLDLISPCCGFHVTRLFTSVPPTPKSPVKVTAEVSKTGPGEGGGLQDRISDVINSRHLFSPRLLSRSPTCGSRRHPRPPAEWSSGRSPSSRRRDTRTTRRRNLMGPYAKPPSLWMIPHRPTINIHKEGRGGAIYSVQKFWCISRIFPFFEDEDDEVKEAAANGAVHSNTIFFYEFNIFIYSTRIYPVKCI